MESISYSNEVIKNEVVYLNESILNGEAKSKGDELVWMTKIKTKEWLDKVKSLYGEKALLQELNNDKDVIRSFYQTKHNS